MKILILSTKMPWPPKDGGSIATLNLCRGLAQGGAEITLLTMNTGKHYFPVEKLPEDLTRQFKVIDITVNTRLKPLPMVMNYLFSSYPYIASRFISEDFRAALKKCLAENNYDIIQLEGPFLAAYVRDMVNHALISFRAHNLEHRIWELRAGEEKNPFRRLYIKNLAKRIRKLEKSLLAETDLLVPISAADEEGFRNIGYSGPSHVCSTGLDLQRYRKASTPDKGAEGGKISLFYIGALDWSPNQEGLDWFFSRIWPRIRKEFPESTLHVAGRNPDAYFRGDTPAKVELAGEVEDALEFFNKHTVMLVPLLSGSGIRIKILEAMAMGKIVICSALAASGIPVISGQHLYIAEKAEDYISILIKLKENPGLMDETAEAARLFIKEKFDNLDHSKKLISYYKGQLTWSG